MVIRDGDFLQPLCKRTAGNYISVFRVALFHNSSAKTFSAISVEQWQMSTLLHVATLPALVGARRERASLACSCFLFPFSHNLLLAYRKAGEESTYLLLTVLILLSNFMLVHSEQALQTLYGPLNSQLSFKANTCKAVVLLQEGNNGLQGEL